VPLVPRQWLQYIFYYPDWQLVSDHAKFCLNSGAVIFGDPRPDWPGLKRSAINLRLERKPLLSCRGRAARVCGDLVEFQDMHQVFVEVAEKGSPRRNSEIFHCRKFLLM
jgi:hypothetical protein